MLLIAAGRPDDKDRKEITEFAEKVTLKLNSDTKNKIKVSGNYPYKVFTPLPVTPISLPACTSCQQCISVCPTHAITIENGTIKTNPEKCILCMACTANCPGNVRIFPPPIQKNAVTQAMVLMLTLPLEALITDYWTKTACKRGQEFDLYHRWEAGEISMDISAMSSNLVLLPMVLASSAIFLCHASIN